MNIKTVAVKQGHLSKEKFEQDIELIKYLRDIARDKGFDELAKEQERRLELANKFYKLILLMEK